MSDSMQKRLEQLAAGELSADERATLAAHIDEWEGDDEVFAAFDSEQAIGALAESPVAFADVFAVEAAGNEKSEKVIDLASRRPLPMRLFAAAAVLAICGVALAVWYADRSKPTEWDGIKGPSAGVNAITLRPIVGRTENGQPVASHELADGGKLQRGDVVLFRYTLRKPARVTIWGQWGSNPAERLWDSNELLPAGDGEVGSVNNALALDPSKYGVGSFVLGAVALPAGESEWHVTELNALSVRAQCPSCSFDSLTLHPSD